MATIAKTVARKAKPKPPRRRRKPEVARALILEEARRVLSEHGPDSLSLASVGERVGVSSALVSHYFGTCDNLIDEAFGAHFTSMREKFLERLVTLMDASWEDWVVAGLEELSEPMYSRMVAWALLSGRAPTKEYYWRRMQGLGMLIDAIEMRAKVLNIQVSRRELEFLLTMIVSAGVAYGSGRQVIWEALRHEVSPELDKEWRRFVAKLVVKQLFGDNPPAPPMSFAST